MWGVKRDAWNMISNQLRITYHALRIAYSKQILNSSE